MRPRDIVRNWVDTFNKADADLLASFYHYDAINHQVTNEPIQGKEAIRLMFASEFSNAEMVCIIQPWF